MDRMNSQESVKHLEPEYISNLERENTEFRELLDVLTPLLAENARLRGLLERYLLLMNQAADIQYLGVDWDKFRDISKDAEALLERKKRC